MMMQQEPIDGVAASDPPMSILFPTTTTTAEQNDDGDSFPMLRPPSSLSWSTNGASQATWPDKDAEAAIEAAASKAVQTIAARKEADDLQYLTSDWKPAFEEETDIFERCRSDLSQKVLASSSHHHNLCRAGEELGEQVPNKEVKATEEQEHNDLEFINSIATSSSPKKGRGVLGISAARLNQISALRVKWEEAKKKTNVDAAEPRENILRLRKFRMLGKHQQFKRNEKAVVAKKAPTNVEQTMEDHVLSLTQTASKSDEQPSSPLAIIIVTPEKAAVNTPTTTGSAFTLELSPQCDISTATPNAAGLTRGHSPLVPAVSPTAPLPPEMPISIVSRKASGADQGSTSLTASSLGSEGSSIIDEESKETYSDASTSSNSGQEINEVATIEILAEASSTFVSQEGHEAHPFSATANPGPLLAQKSDNAEADDNNDTAQQHDKAVEGSTQVIEPTKDIGIDNNADKSVRVIYNTDNNGTIKASSDVLVELPSSTENDVEVLKCLGGLDGVGKESGPNDVVAKVSSSDNTAQSKSGRGNRSKIGRKLRKGRLNRTQKQMAVRSPSEVASASRIRAKKGLSPEAKEVVKTSEVGETPLSKGEMEEIVITPVTTTRFWDIKEYGLSQDSQVALAEKPPLTKGTPKDQKNHSGGLSQEAKHVLEGKQDRPCDGLEDFEVAFGFLSPAIGRSKSARSDNECTHDSTYAYDKDESTYTSHSEYKDDDGTFWSFITASTSTTSAEKKGHNKCNSSFEPFGIPKEELMEDLIDAFEDTSAHMQSFIECLPMTEVYNCTERTRMDIRRGNRGAGVSARKKRGGVNNCRQSVSVESMNN